MIRKIELLNYIESVANDVESMYDRIIDLEQKNYKLEKKVNKILSTNSKSGDKLEKAVSATKLANKAKVQPRDKNGKFIKKK